MGLNLPKAGAVRSGFMVIYGDLLVINGIVFVVKPCYIYIYICKWKGLFEYVELVIDTIASPLYRLYHISYTSVFLVFAQGSLELEDDLLNWFFRNMVFLNGMFPSGNFT